MKLRELVDDPGRPVAFYPKLVPICGSAQAALVACQLLYWTGKQRDSRGWIQKRTTIPEEAQDSDPSTQSLAAETGLSYRVLSTARRELRKRGLLEERHNYLEHLVFFRLNFEALKAAWVRYYGTDRKLLPSVIVDAEPAQRDRPESPAGNLQIDQTPIRDAPFGNLLKGTSTEYTQTTSESAAAAAKVVRSLQVSPEWSPAHGLPVSAEQLEGERFRHEATSAFESALGVNGWPWCSTRVWEQMAELVTEAWKEDPEVFSSLVQWMEGKGKFTAMSIKQIRIAPQQFIDTGWPLFLASRKPEEPEMVQVETDLMRRIREGVGNT